MQEVSETKNTGNVLARVSLCAILAKTVHRAMRQVTSQFVRNNFGECLRLTKDEPVVILKAGRPIAVLVSANEYAHFRFLEDLQWIAKADVACDSGQVIGYKDSLDVLSNRLTALANRTKRSRSEIIRSAIEEKIEDGEEAANIHEALYDPGRTWKLSELLTGKDQGPHDIFR